MIAPPKLPFVEFKWKWASNQPTESLNSAETFLGVLRALYECEGLAPSSDEFQNALRIVGQDTNSPVDLARDTERNLIRNSGQYWKSKGLLLPEHGVITLSDFGKRVAVGEITNFEFAACAIKTCVLPNQEIMSAEQVRKWSDSGISIKPLELILEIVGDLKIKNPSDGFITTEELSKIIVPLSAIQADATQHSEAIRSFRQNKLSLIGWPNCVSGANDTRIVREHLLFLCAYGYLTESTSDLHKFFLEDSILASGLSSLKAISGAVNSKQIEQSEVVRNSGVVTSSQVRKRYLVMSRPGQTKFRKHILKSHQNQCLFTGEKILETLEAAHIKPVEKGGDDSPSNGLCLRSDIHALFDVGYIRIAPDSHVHMTTEVCRSKNYKKLPKIISLPSTVDLAIVEWRWRYL